MNSEIPVSMSDLFSDATQIRLAEISVSNWGTFDGLHTGIIDPNGTVIAGDTGAGKSSLVDALQPLWVRPSKAVFNTAAAQKEKNDRSLVTYIRGKVKSDSVEDGKSIGGCLRNGPTLSGIRALYRSEQTEVTLAVLFWINSSSFDLSDVGRVYVISDRPLPLSELVNAFKNRDLKALRKHFSDDQAVTLFERSEFDAYQKLAHERLQIDNANAPALLTRALGIKQIDNLTNLIRDFVLDPGDIFQQALELTESFKELEHTYAELIDLRAQQQRLADLPALDSEIKMAEVSLAELELRQRATRIYVNRELARIWGQRERVLIDSYETAKLDESTAKAAAELALETRDKLFEAYTKAGGGQIESLKRDRSNSIKLRDDAEKNLRAYKALAAQLQLPFEPNTISFAANQRTAQDEIQAQAKAEEASLRAYADAMTQAETAGKQLTSYRGELQQARLRKDSSIRSDYARLRDQIASELELPNGALVYMAELMEVPPQHQAWHGAIERAVGKFRLTMIVPTDYKDRVVGWVNARELTDPETGRRLNLDIRETVPVVDTVAFRPDGYLFKLQWRDHPYTKWVRKLMSSHDLICVTSADKLAVTPNSLTIEGMIQRSRGHYEKRDADGIGDRSKWYLGFSNKRRIEVLEEKILEAEAMLKHKQDLEAKNKQSFRANRDRLEQFKTLSKIEWVSIDVAACEEALKTIEDALKAVEESSGQLKQAKEAFENADLARKDANDRHTHAATTLKTISDHKNNSSDAFRRYSELSSQECDPVGFELAARAVGILADAAADKADEIARETEQAVVKAISDVEKVISQASQRVIGIMSGFRNNEAWKSISSDWGNDAGSRSSYLDHYHKLVNEGLPNYVERVKSLLNKFGTQSLASLQQEIKSECENIRERIDEINHVMRRAEFRPGSYLQLIAQPLTFELNDRFDKLVREVKRLAVIGDEDTRYKALVEVIQILRKATDSSSSSSKESQRLLDTRFQFDFVAQERDRSTNADLEPWSSTGGKSGGEKESFSGMIVAASLAFVLSPDGAPRPVYSTVFLDEAFSNTSADASQRVIRAFKELKLHLNLVTPFKSIDVARDAARSILLVKKDHIEKTSRLSQVTWEYVDAMQDGGDIALKADALGITIESAPQ